jgi:hypothetical protein
VEALRSPFARVRANPWLAVGIAAAALLVAAWLGWAIYVASDRGINEGLGVLIAWPAIVAALALVSLPFIGGYLLVKRLSSDGGEPSGESAEAQSEDAAEDDSEEPKDEEPEDESGDEEDEEDDSGGEDEEEGSEDSEDEQPEGDSKSDPEPEAAKG